MPRKDWGTPDKQGSIDVFDAFYNHFHFTVDAAASEANAKIRPHRAACSRRLQKRWVGHRCVECGNRIGRFYTTETDGLAQTYGPGDVVFCNPPYYSTGPHSIRQWVRKAFLSARRGALWLLVLPPSVDSGWFHDYIYDMDLRRARSNVDYWFPRGRIHFVDPTPRDKKGGRTGTLLAVFYPPKLRNPGLDVGRPVLSRLAAPRMEAPDGSSR